MAQALLATVSPAPPAFSPASAARWKSPLWKSAHAARTCSSCGNGSASPACRRFHCFFKVAGSHAGEFAWGYAAHLAFIVSTPDVSCRLAVPGLAVGLGELQQVHPLVLFEIGYQQIEDVVRAPHQRELRAVGLKSASRVTHVFVA